MPLIAGFGVLIHTKSRRTCFLGKNEKSPKQLLQALAVRTGLEPATPCVTGMYSNQLNYRTSPCCFR